MNKYAALSNLPVHSAANGSRILKLSILFIQLDI
jgi:hypothetical protein